MQCSDDADVGAGIDSGRWGLQVIHPENSVLMSYRGLKLRVENCWVMVFASIELGTLQDPV